MALHILNFSIDPPDALDEGQAEDLSYNEIESVTEWFAEDVLNIKNAFKERDEHDQNNSSLIKKAFEFQYCQIEIFASETSLNCTSVDKNNAGPFYAQPFYPVNHIPVFSPPPEA